MQKRKQFKGPTKVGDAINDVVATLWENPDVGYSIYEANSVVEITYTDTSDVPTPEEVTPEEDTYEKPIEENQTEDTPEVVEALPETEGTVEEEDDGGGVASTVASPDWDYAASIEESGDLVEYLSQFGFEGNPKHKPKTILNKAKKMFDIS
jgi:hypothetical protein